MESSSEYLRGLVILSVLFALSLGAAVAANASIGVGINITKIICVSYQGEDQWVEIANEVTGFEGCGCAALCSGCRPFTSRS